MKDEIKAEVFISNTLKLDHLLMNNEDAFAASHAKDRAMTLEKAIAFALEG